MNKRQKKKWMKKIIEEEFSYCQGCGKKLNLKKNEYHRRFGTCDASCYASMVGVNLYEF